MSVELAPGRPRLAYIVADPGVPPFGRKGASVHVQELLRAWRDRGYAVRLYCLRAGADVPADLADVDVTEIRLPSGLQPTADRERAAAGAAGALAEAVIADGCAVVHERFALFSTALARITAELGVPGVLEVNSPLIEEQARYRELADRGGAVRALRRQLAVASVITAVSPPVAAWLRGHGASRVRVVPNGVNADRIRPAAARSEAVGDAVFVGTLKPWHGVDRLVRAAALGRGAWRLRIVGDGPAGPELRALAARLAAPVDFRGEVAPADISDHLAGARVGVAPYPRDAEHYFSPLKVYEYAAAGLPVVATDVGTIADIVRPGMTGELVADASAAELDAAVRRVLADPVRARAMGDRARELVRQERSWSRVLDETLAGVPALEVR